MRDELCWLVRRLFVWDLPGPRYSTLPLSSPTSPSPSFTYDPMIYATRILM